MNIAITIIDLKRQEYRIQRIKAIERKVDFENKGKTMDAKVVDLTIDSLQNTISDLTEMIDQIRNISAYEKSCLDLINNQINK